jgi:ketosteroid isomerase-like protein
MSCPSSILFLLLPGVHCALAQSAEMQIRLNRTASNAAIARHDVDGVVRDMLSDYSIVTGRGQHVEGRDSVLALWRKTFTAMPGVVYLRTPEAIVVSKNDSLAWETGQWVAQHSYSGGGNYSAMWRKVDSSWKLAAELFVSLEK